MRNPKKEKTTTASKAQPRPMNMISVSPKTSNQSKAFNAFKNKNLLLHGLPGTGKTFIALYLAISAVMRGDYKQVIIVRSSVPTRDMGFMPGNAAEKMKNYEAPYYSQVNKLFGRGDAYDILKQKKMLVFMPTTFVRGIEFESSVVIIDEAQNMSDVELHSVITRLGENSKMIICGDVRQDDLSSPRFKEASGLAKTMKILKMMNAIFSVEFVEEDIVRSDFLREYIIARDRFERSERKTGEKDSPKLPSFITEATIRPEALQSS